jgi:HTH-type transcriptional regulator/antitoxin HigA
MSLSLDVEKLVPAWQVLRSVVPVSHIESESDYEQVTALLNTRSSSF